jgi:hypothetical protein
MNARDTTGDGAPEMQRGTSCRERRLWDRYPIVGVRASLNWVVGATETTARGDLLNISGGGAALASDVGPPAGVPLWLRFETSDPPGSEIESVEARLVMTSIGPSGMRIAHVQFVEPCPVGLFDLVVQCPG